jgi:hypothetical protein
LDKSFGKPGRPGDYSPPPAKIKPWRSIPGKIILTDRVGGGSQQKVSGIQAALAADGWFSSQATFSG